MLTADYEKAIAMDKVVVFVRDDETRETGVHAVRNTNGGTHPGRCRCPRYGMIDTHIPIRQRSRNDGESP